MPSAKQISANQVNAPRSTGPRTQAGKAISAQNARIHGLLSREVVTKSESQREFNAFRSGLVARLGPEGELEELLVDRIAGSAWRLRRAGQLEAVYWNEEDAVRLRGAFGYGHRTLENLGRYERALENSLFRALHELERLQAARRGASVPVPAAIDVTLRAELDKALPPKNS